MDRETLLAQIALRRPWYQHIYFPEHGISTTDNPANATLDAAWDNVIAGISIEEAARLRPLPKWRAFRETMPPLQGCEVLEVGSNCGFFSIEFARLGAKSVLGIDVAPHWLGNARWALEVLGLRNVRFQLCDFMVFDPARDEDQTGLLSFADSVIPLPTNCYDVVFMSTVLDHLFFPLLAIYKMIRLARRWVVIDVPAYRGMDPTAPLLHLSTSPDVAHHGFTGTQEFFLSYVQRLGVVRDQVTAVAYNDGKNVVYRIDASRKVSQLVGA
jgi:SAM-dependent methyltransferase